MACGEAITNLDPERDHGLLIARHHRDIEVAEAYFDGLDDMSDDELGLTDRQMWQTPSGIFTLQHRPAVRHRRDCLLVYTAHDPESIAGRPWCHIVASDGSILDNDFDLIRSYRNTVETI